MPSEPLTPHPSALIQSMRSIGYSPETALADIVDNSVSAGAKNICVEVSMRAETASGFVVVLDDGCGMNYSKLIDAMRWGYDQNAAPRQPTDLGRFGLGMKTAALSLGRCLTVITQDHNSGPHVACWDLDEIMKSGQWQLEGVVPEVEESLIEKYLPKLGKRGTMVLVSRLDRFKTKAGQVVDSELFKRITNHLGMVFHRFLEKGLTIKFGSTTVLPINLLRVAEPRGVMFSPVAQEPQFIGSTQARIEVAPHVLRSWKNLTDEEKGRLEGPSGWLRHQGFHIYRADRLIVPGGWLKFGKPRDVFKLTRIVINLPNNLDEEWGLNVAKSKVTPPPWLLGDLERIAIAGQHSSLKIYRERGAPIAPKERPIEDNEDQPFWIQTAKSKASVFRLNRHNPFIEALLQAASNPDAVFAFLKVFERQIPFEAINMDPEAALEGSFTEPDQKDMLEIRTAFDFFLTYLQKSPNMTKEEAKTLALRQAPFNQYPELH